MFCSANELLLSCGSASLEERDGTVGWSERLSIATLRLFHPVFFTFPTTKGGLRDFPNLYGSGKRPQARFCPYNIPVLSLAVRTC